MKYLADIGYQSGPELLRSMVPSLKIGATVLMASLAGMVATVEMLFGLNGLTIIAFAVLITLELVTGIMAARKKGQKIQSRPMGRFTFKLVVFLALMFITSAFASQFSESNSWAHVAFSWVQLVGFAWFALENLISVYENYAVISGKDTTNIIAALRKRLDRILGGSDE